MVQIWDRINVAALGSTAPYTKMHRLLLIQALPGLKRVAQNTSRLPCPSSVNQKPQNIWALVTMACNSATLESEPLPEAERTVKVTRNVLYMP